MAIKNHSSTKVKLYVLSWTMLQMAIYTKRLSKIKKKKPTSLKNLSGKFSSVQYKLLHVFMISKFSTEILKVLIYFLIKTELLYSEILMSAKSQSKVFSTPKLVHLITQARKCGKISPTIVRAIYGRLGAFFTKCLHSYLHSELKT